MLYYGNIYFDPRIYIHYFTYIFTVDVEIFIF